jgi:hypothetical protein
LSIDQVGFIIQLISAVADNSPLEIGEESEGEGLTSEVLSSITPIAIDALNHHDITADQFTTNTQKQKKKNTRLSERENFFKKMFLEKNCRQNQPLSTAWCICVGDKTDVLLLCLVQRQQLALTPTKYTMR